MGYLRIICDDLGKVKNNIRDSYNKRTEIYGNEEARKRVFWSVILITIAVFIIDFYIFRGHLQYSIKVLEFFAQIFAKLIEWFSRLLMHPMQGFEPQGFWEYVFMIIYVLFALFVALCLLVIILVIAGVGWLIWSLWEYIDGKVLWFSPVMAGVICGFIVGFILYGYVIPLSITASKFLIVAFGMESYIYRRREKEVKEEIKALEKYVPHSLDKYQVIGELERIDGNRGLLSHYISNLVGQVQAEKDRQLIEKLGAKYEALYQYRKARGRLERVEKEEVIEENRMFVEAQRIEVESLELKKKRKEIDMSEKEKFIDKRGLRKLEIEAEVEDESYRRKLQEDSYKKRQEEELRGQEVERDSRVKKLKALNDEEEEVWREFELQKKRCDEEPDENKKKMYLAQAKDLKTKRLEKISQRRREL